MGRKYRQNGYQDNETKPSGRRHTPRPKREGPRSPRMTSFQKVFRCGMCGVTLPRSFTDITPATRCPKCNAALHSCKNCSYFDPSSRYECTESVPERVSPKDRGNTCELFECKTSVEKETGSAENSAALDPRDAFERLFKK